MESMRKTLILLVMLIFGFISLDSVYAEKASPKNPAKSFDMKQVDHGHYLSIIAGCNDCHTPGFLLSEGKVPEKLWLTGDKFGWRGPWGTTYPVNLRIFINAMTENQWVKTARTLKRRLTFPDGRKQEVDVKAGSVVWMRGHVHIGENIGDTNTDVIFVELKETEL